MVQKVLLMKAKLAKSCRINITYLYQLLTAFQCTLMVTEFLMNFRIHSLINTLLINMVVTTLILLMISVPYLLTCAYFLVVINQVDPLTSRALAKHKSDGQAVMRHATVQWKLLW